MKPHVIYAGAHAEFPDTEPLGGGKAVADYLVREWRSAAPFPFEVVSPTALKMPLACPLAKMGELEYARFCRQFERETTAQILKHDCRDCVVLTNDISEGPNFATLNRHGYRVVSIWHVDVVEFFTKFYLRNIVSPALLARWRFFALMPDVLRLVFEKQYECVKYSARIVVPSAAMREMILRCYPWCPAGKIVVLPWGDISPASKDAGTAVDLGVRDDELVIMTLSRLSPEKGLERLLAALPSVTVPVRVWICGAAAYMQGQRYEQKLRRMADGRVEFLGHVTGARKAALLRRADVFVSPSRHESYGLAIEEARAAGCRIVSHAHYGAAGTIVDCGKPQELSRALNELLATGRTLKQLVSPPPSDAAERLAQVIREVAAEGRC